MKYFSYGMNTNLDSMRVRCPQARSLGAAVLPHYRFEFKSFATVTPDMNNEAHGVLWEITDNCEKALDRLEGYPIYYGKINVWVEYQGELVPCMTYLMYPEEEYNYPSDGYISTLEQGYRAHGIDTKQINMALMALDDLNDNLWLTKQSKDSTIMTSW